jgi:hypothetical protein
LLLLLRRCFLVLPVGVMEDFPVLEAHFLCARYSLEPVIIESVTFAFMQCLLTHLSLL